ncbi:hypothetical protein SALBM311S_09837 [Streptomyces alboniger]
MRADNWKRLATQWTGGKEVRAFGLATWAADQANRSITAKFAPTWASATASAVRQWKIIAIVGPPLALAYSLVAWNAARGVDSVAAAAAVFSASWSMLTMLGFADVVLIEGAIPGVTAFEKLTSETRSTEPVASPPLGRRRLTTAHRRSYASKRSPSSIQAPTVLSCTASTWRYAPANSWPWSGSTERASRR